jgi:hypothetical protein
MRNKLILLVIAIFTFSVFVHAQNNKSNKSIKVKYDKNSSQQVFGVTRLSQTLKAEGYSPVLDDVDSKSEIEGIYVNMLPSDAEIKKEGFALSKTNKGIEIRAVDEPGAMYGLLELADMIDIHGLDNVPEKTVNARFPFRAIKFNIPWGSYRRNESLQQHKETVRDLKYWESFLDMMADNRFNTLTLWSLHPFSYMLRPINFPEACEFEDAELKEWQDFWHTLFQMAKDRGIETYLVNWNVFVSEGFIEHYAPNANSNMGKHFVDSNNDTIIERYTKECVTQVINEYPNLTGLGIGLGEGMHDMSAVEREEWITRTFAAGIAEANRKIKFIHRVPFTAKANDAGSTDRATEKMTRDAIESLDVIKPVWVEIKFNWSHAHSTPNLVQVHGGSISDAYWNPLPKNYAITWMMRNEDFFMLRWGEPDFIREHIAQNGQSYVGGYYVGSECYIPAKEYTHVSEHEHINWTYAWERQWLYYKQWGRLLYNPETTDAVFAIDFDKRFGKGIGTKMVEAYKLASRMPLRFATYIFNTWDFTLYAEGMLVPVTYKNSGYDDKKSPFLSLEELMDFNVLDPDYLSVRQYVESLKNGAVDETKITPLELAEELQQNGEQALAIVKEISTDNPTLECEIMDIQAWSYQSFYFANKLRAAVALETYRLTGDLNKKKEAVALILLAKTNYQKLVGVTKQHHQPVPLIQTGKKLFHWEAYLDQVERDITIAQNYTFKTN